MKVLGDAEDFRRWQMSWPYGAKGRERERERKRITETKNKD